MDEHEHEIPEPINNETEEELIELPEESSNTQELKGKRIITLLTVIVAAINIVVFAIPFEWNLPIDVIGLTLSVLVLVGIILLGLWWKSKPKPPPIPVVNVSSISGSVGTPCKPNKSVRIAREPGNPAATAWTIVRTFTQKKLTGKVIKKYVPSAKFLSYGFIDVRRTLNYTCQKQVCTNGVWANSGASYACNDLQNKTFQVYGGPGKAAPYQAWTAQSITQSFRSDYY